MLEVRKLYDFCGSFSFLRFREKQEARSENLFVQHLYIFVENIFSPTSRPTKEK